MPHISHVDVFKVDIECIAAYKIALLEMNWSKSVFIRITAEDGLYGWGEVSPFWAITGETQDICLAGAAELAGLLLHKDPTHIEECLHQLQSHLVHNPALHSAFDMALYDLFGKITQLPVYRLLGGANRSFQTDNTVYMAEPVVMAQSALVHVRSGFTCIKVKLGAGRQKDIEIIQAIRKAIGDKISLRIDANQAWDYKTAVFMLKTLEPYGIELCEQPVPHWDYESLRQLRHATTIPIVADEAVFSPHDAFHLAAGGYCDYFNIKLSKAGGIYNAWKINTIAESAGIGCMIGSMAETRLGLSAAAHLVCACRNIRFADLDACFMLKEDPISGGITYKGGMIHVPDLPGHGADVKAEYSRRWPCKEIS